MWNFDSFGMWVVMALLLVLLLLWLFLGLRIGRASLGSAPEDADDRDSE